MPRLTSAEIRNYVPGPNDPYDKASYERIADIMDLASGQYTVLGVETVVYFDTESNTWEFAPPPPPPTTEQYQQMLNQFERARAQVEELVWSKDPNQARAQAFRENFNRQIEEYKKTYKP